jgi:hypothetical protein
MGSAGEESADVVGLGHAEGGVEGQGALPGRPCVAAVAESIQGGAEPSQRRWFALGALLDNRCSLDAEMDYQAPNLAEWCAR